jgi:hypothetical protein
VWVYNAKKFSGDGCTLSGGKDNLKKSGHCGLNLGKWDVLFDWTDYSNNFAID